MMISNWLMELDFITRAVLAGLGIALMAGPLGSLIIWRRMAYFGDTLAHATLLGVSIAIALNFNIYIGLISVSLLISGILTQVTKQQAFANDAILGLLSHTTLAIGLIVATATENVRVDLLGYLYGDILSVNGQDILYIFVVMIAILMTLCCFWQKFLSATVHAALAKVEGIPIEAIRWSFVLMLALVFAVAMKLVGVLLITALLIIPTSAARPLAKTPEQMVAISSGIGCLSVLLGIYTSLLWDWPTGPAIVAVAATFFVLSFCFCRR